MGGSTLYVLSETVPNWIMAIAAAAAAVVFVWRRQDRREAQEARHEAVRDAVSATWARVPTPDGERVVWGVLVTNRLPASVTELRLTCSGNTNATELSSQEVPSGHHFFESSPKRSNRAWAFPRQVDSRYVEYITGSRSHTVGELSFSHGGRSFTREGPEN